MVDTPLPPPPPTTPAGWYPSGDVQRYWTEHTAPLAPSVPAPAPAMPAPVAAQLAPTISSSGSLVFSVSEDGKNGTVEVFDDRLVRTRKKLMGKDDIQTLPIKSITGLVHDRKTLRVDEVRITFGSVSYEWKVKEAERFVAEVQARMFG